MGVVIQRRMYAAPPAAVQVVRPRLLHPAPPPRAARCRSADRIDGLDIVAFCPDRTQIRGAPALRPPRRSST
ncbi:hypothetical protein BBK14_24525 [Parafrankia soli]|uniref:Uncharacterized protein n=1 Tax=Parafrankia soli TaxID=2599596 RepID=A0A1S1PPF9_9ACTN|nr:hypothetical protein BBK14_24525 [Parafrankia soli]